MSRLADLGLIDSQAAQALLARVGHESDLRQIRVVFSDQHGLLRGKTVLPAGLDSVLSSGLRVPSTLLLKDSAHRTVFPVWQASGAPLALQSAGDILLVPDPDAFHLLPWAPGSAWLFARPVLPDGSAIPFAPETLLAASEARLEAAGYGLTLGLEVEFHVFERRAAALAHSQATMPATPPRTRNLAPGYQLLTDQRGDAMAGLFALIQDTCEGLGLPLRTLEVEMGPSQVEATFAPGTPGAQARAMVMLRAGIKQACARAGLHASFMCRPKVENAAASGWHLHQSLHAAGSQEPVMMPTGDALTPACSRWIAGLLAHATETCLLTAPTVNGYRRYQPHQLAPDRIQWGRDNRGAMVRAILAPGDPASRVENRVAEPLACPHYAIAAQIESGLDGLQRNLDAPEPVEMPYDADAPALPDDMGTALEAFAVSAFCRAAFGPDFASYYATIKRAEWRRYLDALSDWEAAEYFELF